MVIKWIHQHRFYNTFLGNSRNSIRTTFMIHLSTDEKLPIQTIIKGISRKRIDCFQKDCRGLSSLWRLRWRVFSHPKISCWPFRRKELCRLGGYRPGLRLRTSARHPAQSVACQRLWRWRASQQLLPRWRHHRHIDLSGVYHGWMFIKIVTSL